MKILLTIRKEYREIINPIAILDLAAYARKIGHEVDCYYFFQINKKSFKKKYDLVGLSVLQANGKQSIRDAIFLKKKFNVRTIVGGKWTDTINEESTSILEKNNIEIFKGHGEKLFSDNKIEYDSYPSWDIVDFKTLNDVRGDIMSSRGCPFKCHFCHNTERKVEFFNEKRVANNIQLLFSLNID